jgi:hypothetical protein
MVVDLLLAVLHWLLLIFFGGQALIFIVLMLWMAWTDAIKPRLIPIDDIDRAADDIIANYPDPEEEAFARHERAWYRSDGAEQTYWYRVRKAVRQRLNQE